MIRAAVIGASGYSGAELVRLLWRHPQCGKKNLRLFSSRLLCSPCDYASFYAAFYGSGLRVYALPGSLTAQELDPQAKDPQAQTQKQSAEQRRKEWTDLFTAADVVFLATPPAVSANLLEHYLLVRRTAGQTIAKLIDLSGALRLDDPKLYQQWYQQELPLPANVLQDCQYGLSELFRQQIAQAEIVANPGCYATASILALAPLAYHNLAGKVRIDAKSGVSGAGKQASSSTHFPQANESLSLYKLHRHQHIPEIEMALLRLAKCNGDAQALAPITFTSHLLPISRGIMATCYVELASGAPRRDAELHKLYCEFYRQAPFVQVRPLQGEPESLSLPQIGDVSLSNRCDIGLARNPQNGDLVLVAVLDNLLKGAAGQAVQNMNLLFGLDETLGLPLVGALP